MPWYQFEPEKKFPFAPLERETTPDDWRIPLAVLCWLAAAGLLIAGVVSLFIPFGQAHFGLSSVGASIASAALAWAIFPKGK